MAELRFEEAIARFRSNENNVDIFVNGDVNSFYTATDGRQVPSLTKFLSEDSDLAVQIGKVNEAVEKAEELVSSVAVTPQMFGAVGDGIADDTAALNRWANSGATLQGNNRTYRITSSIIITNDTSIYGNKMKVVHDTIFITPIFDVRFLKRFTFTDVQLDGRKDLKPASQSQAHGVRLIACENFTIHNNYFENMHEHSISVYSQEPQSVPIIGPTILSKKGVITCNHVVNGGNRDTGRGYGIWLFGNVEKFVISNNIITDSLSGICIDDASAGGPARVSKDCVIADNIVFVNTDAFRVESSNNVTVTGNLGVVENDGTFPNGQAITSCMVRSIQQSVESAHKVVVNGNTFQGPQYAFFTDNSENLVVSDNVLIQKDIHNIAYTTSAAICVTRGDAQPNRGISLWDNDISSTTSGIIITRAGTTLNEDIIAQGNTIKYTGLTPPTSSNIGISAVLTNNLTVKDNDVTGFYRNIRVSNQGTANTSLTIVEDNTTRNSVDANMVIEGSQPKKIKNNTQINSGNGVAISFFTGANGANSELSGNSSGGGSINAGDIDVVIPNIGSKQSPEATAAQLSSISSTINTINKVAGREVRDTTNNRKMMAAGSSPTSLWWVIDGSSSITPV